MCCLFSKASQMLFIKIGQSLLLSSWFLRLVKVTEPQVVDFNCIINTGTMDHQTKWESKHYLICILIKISHRAQLMQRKSLKVTLNQDINVFRCKNSNFLLLKKLWFTWVKSHMYLSHLNSLCSMTIWQPQSWHFGSAVACCFNLGHLWVGRNTARLRSLPKLVFSERNIQIFRNQWWMKMFLSRLGANFSTFFCLFARKLCSW